MLEFLGKFILGFVGIGLIVFIHELGHYFVAKANGVDVEVLSYGMGPKIFSYQGKNTEFRISLLPFGGYTKVQGSADLTSALSDNDKHMKYREQGSLYAVSPWRRFLIYAAGPLTNFFLAVIMLAIAFPIPVERVANDCTVAPIVDYPSLFPVLIDQPQIEEGDRILSMNGRDISSWQEFKRRLPSNGDSVDLVIERNGEEIPLTIAPVKYNDKYSFGLTLFQEPVIGRSDSRLFAAGDVITHVNGKEVDNTLQVMEAMTDRANIYTIDRNGEKETVTWAGKALPFAWDNPLVVSPEYTGWEALKHGFMKAGDYSVATLRTLGSLVTFSVKNIKETITGPVSAAETIGGISTLAFQVSAPSGIRTLLFLLSIVSVSLCIGNVLPVPTFDGGQCLITLFEAIKGDAMSPKTYVRLYIFGTVLSLLMVVSMYALDIGKYFF